MVQSRHIFVLFTIQIKFKLKKACCARDSNPGQQLVGADGSSELWRPSSVYQCESVFSKTISPHIPSCLQRGHGMKILKMSLIVIFRDYVLRFCNILKQSILKFIVKYLTPWYLVVPPPWCPIARQS